MKRVLIAHIPNTFNYGSAMMAINLISGLRRKLGEEIEFYCDCDQLNLDRLKTATNDQNLKSFIPEPLKKNRTTVQKGYELLSGTTPFVKSIINNFDVMIVLGGDDLSETYMKGAIIRGVVYRHIDKKCKVILAGQSFGPFNGIYKFLARFIFKKMILITRDDNSFNFSKNELNIKKVIQSSDLAFNDLPNQEIWRKILRKINLIPDGYVVAVPSGLVSKYTSDRPAYIKMWQSLIAYLLLISDSKPVVLLAHVLMPESVNDAAVINEILLSSEISQKENIIVFTSPMQPAEARAILGGAKYIITGRMHAAVSAFFEGKPAISLAYSEKYSGVIGKGLDLSRLIVDCRKFDWNDTTDILNTVIDKIDFLEKNRETLRKKIASAVELCRKKTRFQLDFIADEIINKR